MVKSKNNKGINTENLAQENQQSTAQQNYVKFRYVKEKYLQGQVGPLVIRYLPFEICNNQLLTPDDHRSSLQWNPEICVRITTKIDNGPAREEISYYTMTYIAYIDLSQKDGYLPVYFGKSFSSQYC